MIYSDKVMDHFANPRNVGEIPDADGVGEVGNAKCGDIMKMFLKIENGSIKDVKFKTFGCGAAIATSSIATEMIKGKPIEEALKLTNKARRTAAGQDPLLGFGRTGNKGGACRLLHEKRNRSGAVCRQDRLRLSCLRHALRFYWRFQAAWTAPSARIF